MSRIEIAVGNATASIDSYVDTLTDGGTTARYQARDLMDATAAALLAINTPDAVQYAHGLYELTSGRTR